MASGTRSSKRKSSPSLKRKRRIKDRSKKKSKIVKGKSKKVLRRESPDSYSDDESLSSASPVSYSSTDSDCRRSRSRTRKDTSKSRKKSSTSRLRSKSSESIINERKGKRSKKSKDTDSKRKSIKKKRRREPSTSSSSRSLSCSTCGSSEHERADKEVKRRGRSRRDLDENRSWRGHRSKSRSPCRLGAGGDGSYLIEEQRAVENNPRRLKSIIIFAKESEEDTEVLDKDLQKEDIIYDNYPSTRSNDSNDDCDTRGEASNGKTGYLDDQRYEMVGSEVGIPEASERCDLGVLERDLNASAFEGHKPNVSSANAGSNAADLEAVLRQKALENLKKFKGKVRANAKNPVSTENSCEGEMKQSLGLNADSELLKKDQEGSVLSLTPQNMCTTQESSSVNNSAAESLQNLPEDLKIVNPSEEGNADDDRLEGGEIEVKVLNAGNLRADKFVDQAISKQEKPVLNMPTTESLPLTDFVDYVKDKVEAGESILIQCHGSSDAVDCQMIPIQESSMPMPVPSQSKDIAESMQLPHDTKVAADNVEKPTTEISASLTSNLEGQSSNAKGKEDGDSQFQQKTMSVMRGGEMVQVSYKVYIPKHAPALARRKLKR